jgi:hypothetical protein
MEKQKAVGSIAQQSNGRWQPCSLQQMAFDAASI